MDEHPITPEDSPISPSGEATPIATADTGASPAEPEHSAAPGPPRPAAEPAGARVSGLMWAVFWLLIVLTARYAIPSFVEDIQHALTRGRQTAEYETAGDMLEISSLGDFSKLCQLVSQRVGPTVVNISTADDDAGPDEDASNVFDWRGGHNTLGQGSGVIVDPEGYILTNVHVVHGAKKILVQLSDGRRFEGSVVGQDRLTDLALLKIDADDLTAATWGDSDRLKVGSLVWAVGSPFGLKRSVTFGILSAKNRQTVAGGTYQDFLQTDAAVNPGSSGGPLVDDQGRIIGINTAIVGHSFQGISFAIPSSIAQDVSQRLRTNGYVSRGWLGVAMDEVTPERAERLGLASQSGAYVRRVVGNADSPSPAIQAGIQVDDVIVRWDDREIDSPVTLSREVAKTQIGSTVDVVVLRNGEELTLDVAVGERPKFLN